MGGVEHEQVGTVGQEVVLSDREWRSRGVLRNAGRTHPQVTPPSRQHLEPGPPHQCRIVVALAGAAALVTTATLVIIAAHHSVDAVALLVAALIPSR